eukprot:31265-Pelagococcus_subviridis.AAC.20
MCGALPASCTRCSSAAVIDPVAFLCFAAAATMSSTFLTCSRPNGCCAILIMSSFANSYVALLLPMRFRTSSVIEVHSAADNSGFKSEENPRKMFPSFIA